MERAYHRKSSIAPYDGVIFETLSCCFPTQCPSLCVIHALLSDNLQAYRITPLAMEQARRFEAGRLASCPAPVVTTSTAYRDWILESLGPYLPDMWGDLGVVPLAVDTEAFVPLPRRPSPATGLRLLYVGNLEARKNIHFLLKVARAVLPARPDASLTVVGSGPEARTLAQSAISLGIARQVRFLGVLAPDKVAQEMPKHHIFLLPSLKESFGHVLLEAKLAGLTTLATVGLEVPPEFCDYTMPLEVGQWVKQVQTVEARWNPAQNCQMNEDLRQMYNPQRMTQDLLRYLEK
jgi:glycosyltransferase involved in cell wall biosynthesis